MLVAGALLAGHHPLAPVLLSAAFVLCAGLSFRYPAAWLFVLPAVLPALNFSPWTGWIGFEEFDLLVLAVIAGGHGRLALRAGPSVAPPDRWLIGLTGALALLTAVGLVRGVLDAGGFEFGWFQGYTDPLNSVRVAKPVLFALLLAPLLREQMQMSQARALRRFALGMLAGVAVVALASLWERAAYPGVWDFARPYRTTALFWEMHVGGAAIDAYLALGAPFVVWGVWAARTPWRFAAAAALALLAGYACLVTFSRGLYAAMLVSFALLGLLAAWRRAPRVVASPGPGAWRVGDALLGVAALLLIAAVFDQHGSAVAVIGTALAVATVLSLRRLRPAGWRTSASLALVLAFVLEVVVVFGPGSFMLNRLAATEQDGGNRWLHWRDGLDLMATPADWLWGIGLGRFPARHVGEVADAELSGAVQWLAPSAGAPASVRVSGPRTRVELGGHYKLSQRVASQAGYRVEFDARGRAGTQVQVRVCEVHLLYPSRCQSAQTTLGGTADEWRREALVLRGRSFSMAGDFPPRQAVFSLSVTSPGGVVEARRLLLTGADGRSLLDNGDFERGLTAWLPSATRYFVPWHVDSLLLEILIDRGVFTLLVMAGLFGLAIARWGAAGRDDGAALRKVLLASLAGWLCIGLVSSVLDVPRVALLAFLIATFGLALGRRSAADS